MGFNPPVIAVDPLKAEHGILVGVDSLLLDGEPFPYPTVGDWIIRIKDDQVAVLEVQIMVTLPPPEK